MKHVVQIVKVVPHVVKVVPHEVVQHIPISPPAKLPAVRRLDRVQRTANVVANHLDPATFMILLLDPVAVILGAGLVFVAVGVFGIFLLARLVRLDEEKDEALIRAAARRCLDCLKNASTAVLLKIEQSGKEQHGISPMRATRELDRRDPRHP